MRPRHPVPGARPPVTDRATLDRTAEELCDAFGLTGRAQTSWGRWSRLADLYPGHPAFVIRGTDEGMTLDIQRWDISGGEACWPTTQILSLSLPWWHRLAERPGQRCLIPLTAGTAAPASRQEGAWDGGLGGKWDGEGEGGGWPTWFTLADQPLFTVAGLWRGAGDTRCFAMLICLGDGPLATMPVVIAPQDRERWLNGAWSEVAALQAACAPERLRIGLFDPAVSAYAGKGRDGARPLSGGPMTGR
ncbi:hypothetical protein [Sphingomonas sp.]|uniref:hypothetical protein n=1 Tax=Sphingomonas sp. TaxID=28214 RepID=UPI0031E357E9